EAFHDALWDFLDIVGEKGARAYVAGETMRAARFFPDARLNYAENLLRRRDDAPAIIAHRDDGTRRVLSWQALYDKVSRLAQALAAEGVGEGDRVAAIVTNDLEAITAYLATAALGAIWSSCSPDFGPDGASDRLCQIDPKVLVAVPSYSYAGKSVDVTPAIRAVAEGTQLARIVFFGDAVPDALTGLPCVTEAEWLAPIAGGEIAFNRMGFDAPLAILFSSGTTGKPKCITHSAAGLLLQHKKEL